MQSPTEWQQLRSLLREASVFEGSYRLASGRESDVYVDAKLTTLRAKAMPLVGRVFLNKFAERGWAPAAVGGLTMGADPIAMAVARESLNHQVPIDCFIVRKEPKKHGMQRFIEGLHAPAGLKVVIIDDVCTTGASTATAIERSKDAGLRVLGAVCLVDREMGARELIEGRLGCPFDRVFTLSQLRNEPVGTARASR